LFKLRITVRKTMTENYISQMSDDSILFEIIV